jgi:hypothetical protein
MQNRDKKGALPKDFLQSQTALVEQAQVEYQQRLSAQQPPQQKLTTTPYMQRQMALVEQAQKEYQQRQPVHTKLAITPYMQRQIALVEQAQAERAARIQQEALKKNTDQERARLANKR